MPRKRPITTTLARVSRRASMSVESEIPSNLQCRRKRLRFSVVLYRGDQMIGLGERRIAVPFDIAFLGPVNP